MSVLKKFLIVKNNKRTLAFSIDHYNFFITTLFTIYLPPILKKKLRLFQVIRMRE